MGDKEDKENKELEEALQPKPMYWPPGQPGVARSKIGPIPSNSAYPKLPEEWRKKRSVFGYLFFEVIRPVASESSLQTIEDKKIFRDTVYKFSDGDLPFLPSSIDHQPAEEESFPYYPKLSNACRIATQLAHRQKPDLALAKEIYLTYCAIDEYVKEEIKKLGKNWPEKEVLIGREKCEMPCSPEEVASKLKEACFMERINERVEFIPEVLGSNIINPAAILDLWKSCPKAPPEKSPSIG